MFHVYHDDIYIYIYKSDFISVDVIITSLVNIFFLFFKEWKFYTKSKNTSNEG